MRAKEGVAGIKLWFIGLSVYPVSYILSIIIKLLGLLREGMALGGYILDPPGSLPFFYILTFLDSFLYRFFGTDSGRLSAAVWPIFWLFIILILIVLNTIFFVLAISFLPKKRRFIAIIIVYILLLAINSYIPEINL